MPNTLMAPQIKAPMSVRRVMPGPEPNETRTATEAAMTPTSKNSSSANSGEQCLLASTEARVARVALVFTDSASLPPGVRGSKPSVQPLAPVLFRATSRRTPTTSGATWLRLGMIVLARRR
eukprot:CAMPEP_0181537264 /NCGR_PEP_ID=MMETSP1110-20121109/75256_1 /TAXON_ID=174948 /ORGANISM="Symbiodinium sp., Strain CCMP421" /LENGTH=120 /DNA_ID=CAMNT_0023668819 /DNA_START=164 /DNA_END=522 /DNA_ORIENTATION=-